MFKTEYEKAMERVDSLKAQIAHQAGVASKASNAVFDQMIASIDHHLAGGDLQKLASFNKLTKALSAKAHGEMEVLKQLQLECIEALERANAELPSYAAHASEMRAKIPTAVGGRVFLADKSGTKADFAPLAVSGSNQPSTDPKATLSDIQLGRRFQ